MAMVLGGIGLAIVVLVVLSRLSPGRGRGDPALGSVSERWVAEHRASHAESGLR
jgi:hypothetical protein